MNNKNIWTPYLSYLREILELCISISLPPQVSPRMIDDFRSKLKFSSSVELGWSQKSLEMFIYTSEEYGNRCKLPWYWSTWAPGQALRRLDDSAPCQTSSACPCGYLLTWQSNAWNRLLIWPTENHLETNKRQCLELGIWVSPMRMRDPNTRRLRTPRIPISKHVCGKLNLGIRDLFADLSSEFRSNDSRCSVEQQNLPITLPSTGFTRLQGSRNNHMSILLVQWLIDFVGNFSNDPHYYPNVSALEGLTGVMIDNTTARFEWPSNWDTERIPRLHSMSVNINIDI